jgi:hypothetical protein
MAEDSTKFVPGSSPVVWRKSTFSAYNGSCVEVADLAPGRVGVRDSKAGPGSPVLVFGQADWAAFLGTLKN